MIGDQFARDFSDAAMDPPDGVVDFGARFVPIVQALPETSTCGDYCAHRRERVT